MTGDAATRERRFASARERRLWTATLFVMVAIYSTLGLAGTLARRVTNGELFDAVFGLGAVVVLATIAIVGLANRRGSVTIGISLGITAAYLLAFVRIGTPAERTHLVEYGVVAVFIYAALIERARHGRPVPWPPLLAIALAATIGVLDEVIQVLLPNRVFDPVDIVFNVLAAAMAVTLASMLRRSRRC